MVDIYSTSLDSITFHRKASIIKQNTFAILLVINFEQKYAFSLERNTLYFWLNKIIMALIFYIKIVYFRHILPILNDCHFFFFKYAVVCCFMLKLTISKCINLVLSCNIFAPASNQIVFSRKFVWPWATGIPVLQTLFSFELWSTLICKSVRMKIVYNHSNYFFETKTLTFYIALP